ncbi:MAG: fibrobacter succinogenes major paralogous domain-containing protein [Bacteroidota bacterium]
MKNKNVIRVYAGVILTLFVLFFIVSCKKDTPTIIETGTITDVDGNVYKTVKIGNRWWMAENLKVKRYRNGDSIQFVDKVGYYLDSATWNHTDSGAYCVIDNLNETSQNYQGKKFGFLYNWFAANDSRNIAPEGWHVPSDVEWIEMEEFLGMSSDEANKVNWRGTNEGNKLKIDGGSNGWNQPSNIYNVWGTNESGFTALGGACCMFNGVWGSPGTYSTGFWWTSSTELDKAYYRYLDYNKPNVFRFYGQKTYGFSIRCVKD